MDVILSSGFLAFARHIGFLRALTASHIATEAVVGTSSGALVGALWAAGIPLSEIERELAMHPPLRWMRLSAQPWRGLFDMTRAQGHLSTLLPARFSDLTRPLSVGVRGPGGQFQLLSEGSLPAAVAASCAIPYVFHAVKINGVSFQDGGVVDRLGVAHWRTWRPGRSAIVHWVERTGGKDVHVPMDDLCVVRTPPSGARFWNLGDFAGQAREAERLTQWALDVHLGLKRDLGGIAGTLSNPEARTMDQEIARQRQVDPDAWE